MIIATAGHVDHGKTLLVKALTGVDADRLPEEKARGLTIDLGFAYQDLGDELSAIEPPVFAGLYATYVRGKGLSAASYDSPAIGASADMVARAATEDFKARLIVIVVYGLQPSASTQNTPPGYSPRCKLRHAYASASCVLPAPPCWLMPSRCDSAPIWAA